MKLKTIGVVGAGIMGSGVAQNLAQTGHNVILMVYKERTVSGD
jgi:3-hydroxybutyryl-CoA dehydrogenase